MYQSGEVLVVKETAKIQAGLLFYVAGNIILTFSIRSDIFHTGMSVLDLQNIKSQFHERITIGSSQYIDSLVRIEPQNKMLVRQALLRYIGGIVDGLNLTSYNNLKGQLKIATKAKNDADLIKSPGFQFDNVLFNGNHFPEILPGDPELISSIRILDSRLKQFGSQVLN